MEGRPTPRPGDAASAASPSPPATALGSPEGASPEGASIVAGGAPEGAGERRARVVACAADLARSEGPGDGVGGLAGGDLGVVDGPERPLPAVREVVQAEAGGASMHLVAKGLQVRPRRRMSFALGKNVAIRSSSACSVRESSGERSVREVWRRSSKSNCDFVYRLLCTSEGQPQVTASCMKCAIK